MAWPTGRRPRRPAIVSEGTPDGAAGAPYDRGCGRSASLHGTCQGAHATAVFCEALLRMAVRLVEGLRSFLAIMAVPEWGRPLGYSMGHGAANGAWPIGDHPRHRPFQRRLDLTAQHG